MYKNSSAKTLIKHRFLLTPVIIVYAFFSLVLLKLPAFITFTPLAVYIPFHVAKINFSVAGPSLFVALLNSFVKSRMNEKGFVRSVKAIRQENMPNCEVTCR